MVNKLTLLLTVLALLLSPLVLSNAAADLRLGVGANYWTVLDDIDVDDFDEDGLSYYITLQKKLADLSSLEFILERYEEGFAGTDEDIYLPQLFLLLGGDIYAGAGVGGYYTDGDFEGDLFYAFRAGLNLELLPNIYIDINANYRFENWDSLNEDDIDEDTITLGAAVRVEI